MEYIHNMPGKRRLQPWYKFLKRINAFIEQDFKKFIESKRKIHKWKEETHERILRRILGKYYEEVIHLREKIEEIESWLPWRRYEWLSFRGLMRLLHELIKIRMMEDMFKKYLQIDLKRVKRALELIYELVSHRILDFDTVRYVIAEMHAFLEAVARDPELLHMLLENTSLICHDICESSRGFIRHVPNIKDVIVYYAFKRYIADDQFFALPTTNPESSSLAPINDALRKFTGEGFTMILELIEWYYTLKDFIATIQNDVGVVHMWRRMYEAEYFRHRLHMDYSVIFGRRETVDEMIHCSTYYMRLERRGARDMLREYIISIGRYRILNKHIFIPKSSMVKHVSE